MNSTNLEPGQRVGLIDRLKTFTAKKIESEEVDILHHRPKLLTSHKCTSLHSSSDYRHFIKDISKMGEFLGKDQVMDENGAYIGRRELGSCAYLGCHGNSNPSE